MRDIDSAIEFATKLQRSSCAYDIAFFKDGIESNPPSICDCKFGNEPKSGFSNNSGGEQTGCPELRMIVYYLKKAKELQEAVGELRQANNALDKILDK